MYRFSEVLEKSAGMPSRMHPRNSSGIRGDLTDTTSVTSLVDPSVLRMEGGGIRVGTSLQEQGRANFLQHRSERRAAVASPA